ncbi:hypothetical protein INT47_004495 [Mucor saturninus]|uniref:B30.2/SPRY domain-containing protein n=1 Tax=Mucor saturninus TaxID=64648 RepID=A0A8H7VER5_9FUNG|nr:hypothetical protein INT47_004495 [Mucor saturninus]
MNNKDFEEEPPSYDHAFQSTLTPNAQVHQFGKFQDASLDSYERGEMFIQAFSSQLDRFPSQEAQQVAQYGFLRCMHIDTSIQKNQLFAHPKGNAAFITSGDQVQFWPGVQYGPLIDLDVTAQASHPFLTLREYNPQTIYSDVPTQHYFEMTVKQARGEVVMAIGLSTRPYPIFRMPGWNKFSVGYHSDDGHKFCDDATGGQEFGPSWGLGDTVGCGYCPDTGHVFFTKNGTMIDYAFTGLSRHHYFPSVGVDGPATIHLNFGKSPFLFHLENWAGQFI